MGVRELLRCFRPLDVSGAARPHHLRASEEVGVAETGVLAMGGRKTGGAKTGGGKTGSRDDASVCDVTHETPSLPPLPYGKKLSKRTLAKLQKAEEEAAQLAKAEEEETMSQYLGKSASCTSLNSLPRALSSSSLSRCVTPDRRGKDAVMVQFDGEGHVVVRTRQSSVGSEASWPISASSSVMATPERSDHMGLGLQMAERLEMSDQTSISHSVSATDFSVSIDANGVETMEFIPRALRSVSNPKFDEAMGDSVFKIFAEKWAGTVLVGGGRGHQCDGPVATLEDAVPHVRRNLSWSHFSEISLGMRRASSEGMLNRRHTVLVLTNDIDDDCASEEEDALSGVETASVGGRSQRSENQSGQMPRKVSQVFESHHVHLSKLQGQMGDASKAPEDLLQLMSRKIFESRSDLALIDQSSFHDELDDGGMEASASLASQALSSHDLSECSGRLPRIRTHR